MRQRQCERERETRREEEEEKEKEHRKKERKNMDVATKAKLKRKSFKSWHQQTTHSHSYSYFHWMFNNTTHNTTITENIFKSYVKSDIYNGADIAYFSSSFSIMPLNSLSTWIQNAIPISIKSITKTSTTSTHHHEHMNIQKVNTITLCTPEMIR